jgi:hypothetical protein
MNNYYVISNIKPERLNDVEREHQEAGNTITNREFSNGTFTLTIRRPLPIFLDYVDCMPVFLND